MGALELEGRRRVVTPLGLELLQLGAQCSARAAVDAELRVGLLQQADLHVHIHVPRYAVGSQVSPRSPYIYIIMCCLCETHTCDYCTMLSFS